VPLFHFYSRSIAFLKNPLYIAYHHHHHRRLHAVCLKTGPQPLPKRVLHRVRSRASSFNFQRLSVSRMTSRSCLRLLHRLLFPSIFPSTKSFTMQLVLKTNPVSLPSCNSSMTLYNTYSRFHTIRSLTFSILHQHHILKNFKNYRYTIRLVSIQLQRLSVWQSAIMWPAALPTPYYNVKILNQWRFRYSEITEWRGINGHFDPTRWGHQVASKRRADWGNVIT
jgi:hypothetical protein